jgi:hypothetical protein
VIFWAVFIIDHQRFPLPIPSDLGGLESRNKGRQMELLQEQAVTKPSGHFFGSDQTQVYFTGNGIPSDLAWIRGRGVLKPNDFPSRDAAQCHRTVIEPTATGEIGRGLFASVWLEAVGTMFSRESPFTHLILQRVSPG